jgi:hypothetical protein
MKDNESASERLRREHAAQLITKSVELDNQIAKNEKATQDRKK